MSAPARSRRPGEPALPHRGDDHHGRLHRLLPGADLVAVRRRVQEPRAVHPHQPAVVRRLRPRRQHRGAAGLRDGVFLRWMLNSLLYAGGGRRCCGTLLAAMCGYALAKYRFPGRETLFNVGARRRARAGHGARPAALPDLQQGRGDEHLLVGVPAQPGQPVRGLPGPDLRHRQRARRDCSRRPASTARARCARFFTVVGPADVPGAGDDLPLPVRGRSGTTSSCR